MDDIRCEHVTYRFEEQAALTDIHLRMKAGQFIVLSGPPGSGKSTLLQLLNGILKPTEGEVQILNFTIRAGEKLRSAHELRRKVGLVFQFPERQLFEATVLEDLIFGPLNFGVAREEAIDRAKLVCGQLGLHESILAASPFALSGGQMRKAAIGAVLISDPDILVLDEPTASLDPASREELLRMFRRLCDEQGKTIVIVTHRLEEVLPYADDYLLMQDGKVAFHGSASELLSSAAALEASGIPLPVPIRLLVRFADQFETPLPVLADRHALTPEGIAAYMSTRLVRRYASCAAQ